MRVGTLVGGLDGNGLKGRGQGPHMRGQVDGLG